MLLSPRVRSRLFWLLTVLLVCYLGGGLFLTLKQRSFVYLPMNGPTEPKAAGLEEFERRTMTRPDDGLVSYWESTDRDARPILLYFHGNGGGLYMFTPALRYLQSHGFHVVAMEYRGYPGAPPGSTEAGIVGDGKALMKALRRDHPDRKLVIWGYSLGTGVATQVAATYAPDALVLEAPFTAVVDRASEMFPLLPVGHLLEDRFLSREAIRQIRAPLFIMHGEDDVIIPPHHGRDLYALANAPKEIKTYASYGHLDLIESPAYADALAFIRINLREEF